MTKYACCFCLKDVALEEVIETFVIYTIAEPTQQQIDVQEQNPPIRPNIDATSHCDALVVVRVPVLAREALSTNGAASVPNATASLIHRDWSSRTGWVRRA